MAFLKRNARQGLLGTHDAKRHREAGWRARMELGPLCRSDVFLACQRRAKRSRRGPTTTCYRSRWKPAPRQHRGGRGFFLRVRPLFQFRTPAPKVAGGPSGGCRFPARTGGLQSHLGTLCKGLFQRRSTARDGQGALIRCSSPFTCTASICASPRSSPGSLGTWAESTQGGS